MQFAQLLFLWVSASKEGEGQSKIPLMMRTGLTASFRGVLSINCPLIEIVRQRKIFRLST